MTASLQAMQQISLIASEDIVSSSFPTHFTVVLRLRSAMSDRQAPRKRLVKLMNVEPVISARLIQAANVAINYKGDPVEDIGRAIDILGSSTVRRISLGVAMSQLANSKELLPFSNISRSVWLHSLHTAAAASIFAERLTTLKADRAFFLGLVSNIGIFYFLYQSSRYRILRVHPEDVESGVQTHGLTASRKVIEFLGLPKAVQDASDLTAFEPIEWNLPPKTLNEVLQAAYVHAMDSHPWHPGFAEGSKLGPIYTDLRRDIIEFARTIQQQFMTI